MAVYLGSNRVCTQGGTKNITGGISLQSKTVSPSESSQTVTADSGYDGLSQVTVNAVSNTYVGSGVTKKSATTYTPSTSNQTIASGTYLSGAQTIKGDSNLVASNIKSGVSIFGVSGSYTASGSSGLDTSDATATASDIVSPKTAYINGEKVEGTLVAADIDVTVGDFLVGVDTNNKLYFRLGNVAVFQKRYLVDTTNEVTLRYGLNNLGDATAADVVAGKTFTSASGLKVTGTHQCSSGSSSPSLQSKSVSPSESSQTVKPDSGYDGLSQVTVSAISTTYVGSGVTKKAAATYTPSTSDQTIASGQYLNGTQTIKGDSNLVTSNIKSGVSIFGVAGSYTGSGSSGGLVMKSGTTTSATINTGLSSIKVIIIYKDSFTATGLIQGVYATDEDKLHYTYCSQYSSYFKTCAASTSTASSVSGGTFTLGTSGTSGLSSNTTYNWIAFGEA